MAVPKLNEPGVPVPWRTHCTSCANAPAPHAKPASTNAATALTRGDITFMVFLTLMFFLGHALRKTRGKNRHWHGRYELSARLRLTHPTPQRILAALELLRTFRRSEDRNTTLRSSGAERTMIP